MMMRTFRYTLLRSLKMPTRNLLSVRNVIASSRSLKKSWLSNLTPLLRRIRRILARI